MAETIESFVGKLQTEGVEAGRKAAEEVRAEAQRRAEKTLADAKAQAEKVLADAKAEADGIFARSRSELELAARDTILRLREALGRAVQAALARGAEAKLVDSDFVGKVLHQIMLTYAKADCDRTGRIKINVPSEMREKLVDWALHEIMQERDESGHASVDLKGTLATAGFEYEVSGATVEVTLESVVQVLSELVGPDLRELIERAVAERKD